MREAVDRIKLAVSQGEPIMIYGDYDADGVTSTSVMLTALRQLSADVDFYIPDRFTEGYGPNEQAFRSIKSGDFRLSSQWIRESPPSMKLKSQKSWA